METETSTPAQHAITLINQTDGSVHGHRAGCADITRRTWHHADEPWTFDVANKVEAWASYNADFIAECPDYGDNECDHDEAAAKCSNAYTIKWLPCADHVPAV